ncbi:lipopolysaccharide heptosyltransferase family protein [Vibrio coralliilyticus]|uniref:Heptosyltransferase n=1 Tax=Vibrio coralliilyticus TaxID=190893 RepID=A0AAN0SE68_9VIBR|nr:glycosyltransferase family 9 protein [Vibrio coralliilyticus]AIW20326.1 heptosyltransferase [Vibrio coralliilyticus]NOH41806.1 lipopolysaccharide heptosyltransferase family protein [Vibrio coralliilyticus]
MRVIISKLQRFRDIARRYFGVLLFDQKKESDFDPEHAKTILFIRNDAKLGDAIVSSGVISKIRRYRPDINIIILTTPSLDTLFKKHFSVDRVVHLSKRPSYREIRFVSEEVGSVDIVVSLNLDMKMKDIYLLNKLDSKIVIGVDRLLKIVNFNISKDIQQLHYAEKFDYITKLLGISGPREKYQVPVLSDSVAKMESFLTTNGIKDFILLNPFGSGNERKLRSESIAAIVDVVLNLDKSLKVVVLTAPDTKGQFQSMRLTNDRVFHFTDSESIYDAIAAVQAAKLIISVDTSIVHIASGLHKPQVAIYSDDTVNFSNWHPNSDVAEVIVAHGEVNNFEYNELAQKTKLCIERT